MSRSNGLATLIIIVASSVVASETLAQVHGKLPIRGDVSTDRLARAEDGSHKDIVRIEAFYRDARGSMHFIGPQAHAWTQYAYRDDSGAITHVEWHSPDDAVQYNQFVTAASQALQREAARQDPQPIHPFLSSHLGTENLHRVQPGTKYPVNGVIGGWGHDLGDGEIGNFALLGPSQTSVGVRDAIAAAFGWQSTANYPHEDTKLSEMTPDEDKIERLATEMNSRFGTEYPPGHLTGDTTILDLTTAADGGTRMYTLISMSDPRGDLPGPVATNAVKTGPECNPDTSTADLRALLSAIGAGEAAAMEQLRTIIPRIGGEDRTVVNDIPHFPAQKTTGATAWWRDDYLDPDVTLLMEILGYHVNRGAEGVVLPDASAMDDQAYVNEVHNYGFRSFRIHDATMAALTRSAAVQWPLLVKVRIDETTQRVTDGWLGTDDGEFAIFRGASSGFVVLQRLDGSTEIVTEDVFEASWKTQDSWVHGVVPASEFRATQ